MKASTRKSGIIVFAVAAVLGAAFAIGPARRAYHEATLRRDLARLAELASARSGARSRLSVSTAPPRIHSRSAAGIQRPTELYAAANDVLQRAKQVDVHSALRASAIAHYYAGNYPRAVQDLEKIARHSPSAAAWSDLAAARLEASNIAPSAIGTLRALVAIERALDAEPTFAPALYNRAAILERMGLRGHAREAWHVASVAESDPAWADDIRKHIDDIPPDVDEALAPKILAALNPEDPSDVSEGAARFPQHARRYAEGALPVEWASAIVKGDAATADRKLSLARALAVALRDRFRETLAAEAIATIDEARHSGNAERVAMLTSAYIIYGEARALLARHDFDAAEIKLGEAARLFAHANNPMASVARYNAATAILEQNRVEEAAAQYATLARAERTTPGHRGLLAQLEWHIARVEGIRGRWDAALHAAHAAVGGFRALGERRNTGFMENMLAELYDYLGQPERAWTHRLVAFDLLSAAGNAELLQVSLGAAARDRIRRKDWPAALALLGLEIDESRRVDQDALLADALARRSRVKSAAGDLPGAHRDILAARTTMLRLKDPQERAQIAASIDVTEGIVRREEDPVNSVRRLTSAIEFYQRASKPLLLPELHLERGRSHLAASSETEALADFSSGIDRLEEQRATLSDFDLHSTAADAGEDLYIEAVRLAARRNDVEAAYRFAERSRGRALMSRFAARHVPAPARVANGTRVVELMMLPEKLIVFTIDRELRMKELDIGREKLEHMARSLTAKIIDGATEREVRTAAAELYDVLLRPLGPVTAGVSTLVFVPGGILERVPWSVLYDREQRQYLVQDVTVMSAPSVTLSAVMEERHATRARRALIVGNPKIAAAFVDFPVLRGAEREAQTIARYYDARTLLFGEDATISRFSREAQTCDVLHFAGHAVSSETSDDQSFLVLAPDETTRNSGVLYSRDIVRLNLGRVSLVVLAACGTIRGPTVHVDGMPSIGRSFIAAGAKAVVGTLWDVEDERSAALFEQIHRDVSAGAPVARAVRAAQLDAIRSGDPDVAHPKNWGGLTLIGRAAIH